MHNFRQIYEFDWWWLYTTSDTAHKDVHWNVLSNDTSPIFCRHWKKHIRDFGFKLCDLE